MLHNLRAVLCTLYSTEWSGYCASERGSPTRAGGTGWMLDWVKDGEESAIGCTIEYPVWAWASLPQSQPTIWHEDKVRP